MRKAQIVIAITLAIVSCSRFPVDNELPPGYSWKTMENLGSLPSPDGRYELIDKTESETTGDNSMVRLLYLRSLSSGSSEVVFPYTAEACASWGPDSRRFFVNSPTGGTSSGDCIVFTLGGKVESFSMTELIASQDKYDASFLSRHRVFVSGLKWLNPNRIGVHIWSWNDGYSEEETIIGVMHVNEREFKILEKRSGLLWPR